MNEYVIYWLIAVYVAGFVTGGLFFYDIGQQRANQKNIERINKILGNHINNKTEK